MRCILKDILYIQRRRLLNEDAILWHSEKLTRQGSPQVQNFAPSSSLLNKITIRAISMMRSNITTSQIAALTLMTCKILIFFATEPLQTCFPNQFVLVTLFTPVNEALNYLEVATCDDFKHVL